MFRAHKHPNWLAALVGVASLAICATATAEPQDESAESSEEEPIVAEAAEEHSGEADEADEADEAAEADEADEADETVPEEYVGPCAPGAAHCVAVARAESVSSESRNKPASESADESWRPDGAPVSSVRTDWSDRLPSTLPYYADQPTPDGYYLAERPRYELVGWGTGILAGTWLASVGTALYLDNAPDGSEDPNFDDNYWPMFIPIAGPFATIGTGDSSGTGAAILALDGVVQAGAAAMILTGFMAPRTELVRKEWYFDVSPIASSTVKGLAVSGSM